MNRFAPLIAGATLTALSAPVLSGLVFLPVTGIMIEPTSPPAIWIGEEFGPYLISSEVAGDFTGSQGATGPNGAAIPFSQRLKFSLDPADGVVRGTADGRLALPGGTGQWISGGHVQGKATCLPMSGDPCGQLVVHLTIDAAMSAENDPGRVGLVRFELLGSLVRHGSRASWASLAAHARIAGDDELTSLIGGSPGID